MLHYVIFALVAVSTCSGDNPATPVLQNELFLLDNLMGAIEERIETVATHEISALTNASVACWEQHLADFKNEVQTAYKDNLSELREELQTKLDSSSSMTQDQLDALELEVSDSNDHGLASRLTINLEEFVKSATNTLDHLSHANSFTCST